MGKPFFILVGLAIAGAFDYAIIQSLSSPLDWLIVAALSIGEAWLLLKFASGSSD